MEHEPISTKGKSFHCDLCNVKIVSGKAVEDHLQGKKHQRLTAIHSSRQKQAETSIFVGGLNKLVSELELTDYFSKFGPVAQVIVDKDKGKYAIVEFSQKGDAEKAAEEEKQKMNGKKITVRPRENKPFALKSKQQATAGKKAKTAREKEMDSVLEGLLEAEDVCSQMTALSEEICLDQSDLQLRYLICDLLQEVFVEMFPKCRVFPYGSSVSGFGVKGCDLDLQIDLGRDDEQYKYKFASMLLDQEAEMETNDHMKDGPLDKDGSSNEQPDTSNMAHEEILQVLCRLLKQCVPSCQHVRVIPSSRRPVIKFIHKESGLHCDLSLDNRLALRNTELLHFYSSLDERVRPLVCCLRHWAKHQQLAGNQQGPGPKLTNYALTLLVVHYLQNTQPALLPTIHQLRELSGPSEGPAIAGWDCSFTTDATKVSCLDNTETIESLMKGFFSFYTKCDFTTNVLCPVSGTAIPLTQFNPKMSSDSSSSSKEFKVGPVNIQDPLELTHNVAMNVNDKIAGKMREELRKSSLTSISLRYRKQGEDVETGRIPRWGFLSLLEERDGGRKKTEGRPLVIIPLKMSQVTPEFLKRYEDAGEMKQAWCQEAENFVMRLMQDVLGIACSEESPDNVMEEMEDVSQGQPKDINESVEIPVVSSGACRSDMSKDNALRGEEIDEDEEPARKRQRIALNLEDDELDMSMTSSSSTSMISPTDLTSPASTNSPAMDRRGSTFSKVVCCKANHAVWIGRRKLRRKLQMEKPWGDAPIEELGKEKLVTQEIFKLNPTPAEALAEFRMEIRRKLAVDCTAVIIAFSTIHNEVNTKNFAHFFDEFVSRMLVHLKM